MTRETGLKMLFVVGSSRSGTTMMGRILGRNPSVFPFNELHFFEQLWDPQKEPSPLTEEAALALGAQLMTIQRDGYYTPGDRGRYTSEAQEIINSLSTAITAPALFEAYLQYESKLHGRSFPCDQTPRNIFYLPEILALYPQAYAVIMIRDPRDVLLSQKNKWRRRRLGAHRMPFKEVMRSWVNYHPITMSMLWNSGIKMALRFAHHPRVVLLRFEDLLAAPEEKVQRLCAAFGLEFHPAMLQVPQIGSSLKQDRPEIIGINQKTAGRWQNGGLSNTEIFISQRFTQGNMRQFGYEVPPCWPNLFALVAYGFTWPLKSAMAFSMNFRRTRNLFSALKRRLQS